MLTAHVSGICKKHAVTLCDNRIYTVDAFGVRESSPEAEDFTLVGTREEYPGVPDGEGLEYEAAQDCFPNRVRLAPRGIGSTGGALGRRFRKSDVPALAAPEVFEHLREHYLKR